jgi:hypothetical protein
MNWEAVGAVGEVFGATVVVATMFYLAMQIRENKRSNQMLAATRIAESADSWIGQIVRDEKLNDIYQKGMRDYGALELSERNRFDLLIMQFLRSIEGAWTHEKLGFLDRDQWYGYRITTQRIIGSPGGNIAFNKQRMVFSPEYGAAIDLMISGADQQKLL